jgi:hypothetical protein
MFGPMLSTFIHIDELERTLEVGSDLVISV